MRQVVFIGTCQLSVLHGLYRRFIVPRTADQTALIRSYTRMQESEREALSRADVIIQQLSDFAEKTDLGLTQAPEQHFLVPLVTAGFLWPFAGQPHVKDTVIPAIGYSPYPPHYGDRYLNRMIKASVEPEIAVDRYLNEDINKIINLERLYEIEIDRQRERDQITGYDLASVIESHFRDERLFFTFGHLDGRMAAAFAEQFFNQVGASANEIARLRRLLRVSPFHKTEIPMHPQVIAHFGLRFLSPDYRYRFENEGRYTFREFAMRYMRFEFNADLAEGIVLSQHSQGDAMALPKLTAGLDCSPDSPLGNFELGRILSRQRRLPEAIAAVRRAVELDRSEPRFPIYLAQLLADSGDTAEALAVLREAIGSDPTNPDLYVRLSSLLIDQARGGGKASP